MLLSSKQASHVECDRSLLSIANQNPSFSLTPTEKRTVGFYQRYMVKSYLILAKIHQAQSQ